VDVVDFFTLLAAWGGAAGGGPCDVDFDGVIDLEDLLALIGRWGACPVAASATGRPAQHAVLLRSPDVNGNGAVDVSDLEAIKAAWGPCGKDNPADLDGDGVVGTADLFLLTANWESDPRPATSTR
jgi:hypothetical protein